MTRIKTPYMSEEQNNACLAVFIKFCAEYPAREDYQLHTRMQARTYMTHEYSLFGNRPQGLRIAPEDTYEDQWWNYKRMGFPREWNDIVYSIGNRPDAGEMNP